MIFDDRTCELGEGALWHPQLGQLFWFDILNRKLRSRRGDTVLEWDFAQMVSAAGWAGGDTLLVASETALLRFDLASGSAQHVVDLEADDGITRSNDGRADPFGGFWIGTMGKAAQAGAGAIYRYYRGELRKLFGDITITNSICFAPDGRTAYFSDTMDARVMRVALDGQGWPLGTPQVYLDFRGASFGPDGAVIDAAGNMWLAQWGAGRVACFDPSGQALREVAFDAPHTSCPAFGGADGMTLFCTTALQGMDAAARAATPQAGMVFAQTGVARGQAEHQVIL